MVRNEINDVKDVLVQDIGAWCTFSVLPDCFLEKLVKRGEKVELLVDKTHKMKHQAFKFESTVRYL